MYENYYEYEDELDIKALFVFVLRKWHILLSFMIVGCIFGCFFSVYKIYQSRPEAVLTRLNSLDKQEINEFEIKQYNDFKNLYDDYLKYEDKSLIMKLDPNSVYTATSSHSFTSSVSDIDKYDGVALVSEVNKTNTRGFEREVEIARKLNKDIIGFISVR